MIAHKLKTNSLKDYQEWQETLSITTFYNLQFYYASPLGWINALSFKLGKGKTSQYVTSHYYGIKILTTLIQWQLDYDYNTI